MEFDRQTFLRITYDVVVNRHMIDVSVVVLLYDHILTFAQEVEYMWKPKFSPATLLFLFNRYWTPMHMFVTFILFRVPGWPRDEETCIRLSRFLALAGVISLQLVEVVLLSRTYALFGANSRRLLAFLLFLFFGQAAVMAITIAMAHGTKLDGDAPGCLLNGNFLVAQWITPSIVDAVLLGLTIYRIRHNFKDCLNLKILRIIRRDGILYFVVVLMTNLFTSITFLVAPAELKGIGIIFSILMSVLISSRLQLNLRSPALQHDYNLQQRRTPAVSGESHSSSGYYNSSVIPVGSKSTISDLFLETLQSFGHPLDTDGCWDDDRSEMVFSNSLSMEGENESQEWEVIDVISRHEESESERGERSGTTSISSSSENEIEVGPPCR